MGAGGRRARGVPILIRSYRAEDREQVREIAFETGYLVGCVDTARAPSPLVAATRSLLRRQLLLRPGPAGFFRRSIWDTLRDGSVPSGELSDSRWPAHLHINLLRAARGMRLRAGGRMHAQLKVRSLGSAGGSG